MYYSLDSNHVTMVTITTCVASTVDPMRTAPNFLAKLWRLRDVLPPETKKVYNALVLPHLDYTAQWSGKSAQKNFNRR